MTDTQRMEAAYKADPNIGRPQLSKVAGVGEKRARLFLQRKRREAIGGTAERGALIERLTSSNLSDAEIKAIIDSLTNKPREFGPKSYNWIKDSYKFIACGDSHWGHKESSPDWWWMLCDIAAKENCDSILHAGDVLEGMSGRPGHVYELDAIGFDAQVDLAKSYITEAPCNVHGIDGNHDQWYMEKNDSGCIVGKALESVTGGKWVNLGQDEAKLNIGPLSIGLWHGRDGASYATSYRTQKYIEGLQGGEKPNILLSGHAHKSIQHQCRNVQVFEVGTGCFQTKFMRGKKLAAHVGFWLIEAFFSEDGIERLRADWFPMFR